MKQPSIHQNLIGKRELAEFNAIVDDINNGKIKYNAKEADNFKRVNKIGPYREWEIDFKRIEEIHVQVLSHELHMHPTHHQYHQTRKLETENG
jgi:hypothetical protein